MQEKATYFIPTDGYTIYHVKPATVDFSGERAVVAASYEGVVLCYRMNGIKLWEAQTGGFFPFDMDCLDIDGDGLDETMVASSDGKLYVFDHTGQLMFIHAQKAPLISVCAVKNTDEPAIVLTGGIEQRIDALSKEGEVVNSIKGKGVVRFLKAGCILGNGRYQVAVLYCSSCRMGSIYLHILIPENLSPVWKKPIRLEFPEGHTDKHDLIVANTRVKISSKVFSMALGDINEDGKDEILLSRGFEEPGKLFAFDGTGRELPLNYKAPKKFDWAYRMNFLSYVNLK